MSTLFEIGFEAFSTSHHEFSIACCTARSSRSTLSGNICFHRPPSSSHQVEAFSLQHYLVDAVGSATIATCRDTKLVSVDNPTPGVVAFVDCVWKGCPNLGINIILVKECQSRRMCPMSPANRRRIVRMMM
jgi:hypothetical protein